MLETEIFLKGHLSSPIHLKGKLSQPIKIIEPVTQEITIEPKKEQIVKTPDEGFNGFSKVTVEAVNHTIDENIKSENIRENVSILGVIGSLQDKTLGTKVINTNGIYNALDDDLDGYSSVEVATSGVDINDYFLSTTSDKATNSIKRIPKIEYTGTNLNNFVANMINLEEFELTGTGNVTNMANMCFNCAKLKKFPLIDTSNVTNMGSMLHGCSSLIEIPLLNTANVTNMNSLFRDCSSLTKIPLLNTANVTDMDLMFYNCGNLLEVPLINTNSVTTMKEMFNNCVKMVELPQLDTSNVANFREFCYQCMGLKYVPSLNTSKATNLFRIFGYTRDLISVGELDGSSAINVSSMFLGYLYSKLNYFTTFGGIKDVGKAYLTTASSNNSNYSLDFKYCPELTEQSLINVLTKLYDIKTKGCNVQQVVLGSTNLAKLTSEAGQQALLQATEYGWSVS